MGNPLSVTGYHTGSLPKRNLYDTLSQMDLRGTCVYIEGNMRGMCVYGERARVCILRGTCNVLWYYLLKWC